MKDRNYFRILSLLEERPWAMTEAMMRTIHDILQRPAADLEAVAAKIGRPLENTGGEITMRGSTAILSIEGPIFRYANLFTMISGATSTEMAALAFDQAIENPAVSQIVLHINSPGGDADGISSFADQVHAGSLRKPVIAYVDFLGASAAYWIASAASSIVADESAFLGSIGVRASVVDRSAAQERQGVKTYKIVSSQSPRKEMNPATDQGRADLQEMIDSMAELFISRVAQFRGTTFDRVASDFGQGGVMPAHAALEHGMIDRVQAFEPFLRSIDPQLGLTTAAIAATTEEVITMAEPTHTPPPTPPPTPTHTPTPTPAPTHTPTPTPAPTPTPPTKSSLEDERARIKAILNAPEAKGREALAHAIAFETTHDAETAIKLLAAAPVAAPPAQPAPTSSFDREMARVKNPQVGPAQGDDTLSVREEAAAVLAFIPKRQRFGT